MKLIILEGIPTTGKSVLGEKIAKLLKNKLNKDNFEVFYFNDDIRNEFKIDILEILKNQDNTHVNLRTVKKHFQKILQKLIQIEHQKKKECVFVIDRFHFSYLSFLDCEVSKFSNLEKSIRDFTFYIFLGFKNYNEEIIFNRLHKSLDLREREHGFTNYFNKLISDESKGKTPKERIYNHYLTRYNTYNKSLKHSTLKNKEFVEIDNIFKKRDYDKVLKKISHELLEFVLS